MKPRSAPSLRPPNTLAALALALALAAPACEDGETSSGGADVTQPLSSCSADPDCDDGLACTLDRCVPHPDGRGRSVCQWQRAPGTCFVNGVCATPGEARPGSACEVCDPATPDRWTLLPDDTPCTADACLEAATCRLGVCVGTPRPCEDDNPCTRDGCDPATGCSFTPLIGYSCDDEVRCTLDDRCDSRGECVGTPRTCDDGDPCTLDDCNEVTGCTHTPTEGTPCDDGNACTVALCRGGGCVAVRPETCDDGNVCTLDTCDPIAGCVHLPTLSPCCIGAVSVCDDGNPCTDDSCDPATGACSHADNTAACDDGNRCTAGDTCEAGVCVPGAALACDDGNPCTLDACDPSRPELCFHSITTGACDDGIACTTNDMCRNGVCRGDTSNCVCEPNLSSDGVKLTSVQLGDGGTSGQGLDVDQNPATCSPQGQCSGGIDNTLSILAGFANPSLASAVSAGNVMLVLELSPTASNPMTVAVYQARLAPNNPGCNFQTQTCDYHVSRDFLDPVSCEPVARLTGTRTGNRLVAGGPGTRLPFSIPFDGADLEVLIANVRIEVDLTIAQGQVSAVTGVLGGAVPKQTLIDGLRQIPESALPAPRDAIISLVESLVVNDIDTDGDGTKDAASIGVRIIGIDARLTGVGP